MKNEKKTIFLKAQKKTYIYHTITTSQIHWEKQRKSVRTDVRSKPVIFILHIFFFSHMLKTLVRLHSITKTLCQCQAVKVTVPNQEIERSCICVLEVMYLCVRGHAFVS
jgi:hypothetical protein